MRWFSSGSGGSGTAGITQLTTDVVAGPGTGSQAATIAGHAVTNAKSAQMAAHTIKGNNTAVTADPIDLTDVQVAAELPAFTGDTGTGGVKGSVPAPASGDAAAGKFLDAGGGWAVPAASILPSGGSVGQPLLNSAPGAGGWGDDVFASAGNNLQLQGGADGGAGAGAGLLNGGNDAGHGAGNAVVAGGSSNTTAVTGGTAGLAGGNAGTGDANGGDILVSLGMGHGTGRAGHIIIANATSTPGILAGTLTNSPVVGDPAIWLEVVITVVGGSQITGYIPVWGSLPA